MDNRAGPEEQQGLEHRVRKQVEHAGHVTEPFVSAVARHAEGHHHETDLRYSRKGQHALDIGLHARDRGGKQRGKRADVGNAVQHLRGFEIVDREEPRHQIDAGHDHRRGMDQRRHRGRAFHRIGQPDMQREHRRLTGAADKDQRHRPCQRRSAHEGRPGSLGEDRTVARSQQSEIERLRKERQQQDADQKSEIGEPRHDERLFRSGDRFGLRIVEPDQQVGRNAHQLPEDIHLENIGRHDQSEHRATEQRQESIVAFETAFALHVTEAVNVHHQRHGRNHDQHHHRDRVEQYAQVDVQVIGKTQPLDVERHPFLVNAVHLGRREVLPGRPVSERGRHGHRQGADESRRACFQFHAQQTEHQERQQRQQYDQYRVFHIA